VEISSLVLFLFAAASLAACGAVVAYSSIRGRHADRRAEALLRDVLTPVELGQLSQSGYVDVPSRTTSGRVYRVPASHGLVAVLDDGHVTHRLCLMPLRAVPAREYILVHKLLLEGDEDEYWRRANQVYIGARRPRHPAEVRVWTGSGPGMLGSR
jgi:hypothetical protein